MILKNYPGKENKLLELKVIKSLQVQKPPVKITESVLRAVYRQISSQDGVSFSFHLSQNLLCIFPLLLQNNQADLENATEVLSGYLERDISQDSLQDIKQKVQDKYR